MKYTLLSACAIGALVATPAAARDGEWYFGVEGGVVQPEDIEYDVDGGDTMYDIEQDLGYDVDGILGYDFGAFRLELEAGYKNSNSGILTASGDGVQLYQGNVPLYVGSTDTRGEVGILSGMLNGLVDLGADDGVSFFAGGGLGIANVDTRYSIGDAVPVVIDDDDTGFAWQLLAGVRAPISDTIDVVARDRYFNVDDVNYTDGYARDAVGDITTHSGLIGVIANFGGADPLPPVVAPPPVTPPPPPVVTPPPPPVVATPCNTGPYIVFFDWDESVITPAAAQILDSAVSAYGNCGSARIMLAGYTDTSGSQAYNLGLAARRNASVRDYLTARSVPDARITSEAFGEENLRVPTADGVRELQNRRVEITYGPGSGM